MSMNDEQFQEDTEALRRGGYVSFVDDIRARDAAQREALAEAVGLLRFDYNQDERQPTDDALHEQKVRAFLARHAQSEPGTALVMPGETVTLSELRNRAGIEPPAQPVWHWQGAEQQESLPRLVSYSEEMATCTLNYKGREYYFTLDGRSDEEAQGAQAGDLASAVRVLLEVPQLQGEQAFSAQPIIDRVRAALATQPAAGEPVYQWNARAAWIDSSERGIRIAKENGHQTRVLWKDPPAAAHGGEAVQCAIKNLVAVARTIDKEAFAKGTQNFPHGHFRSLDYALQSYDAAMRAQGEGGAA